MSKEEQYQKLCEINRVEGFDPAAFAVEYTDMNTGEVCPLPAKIDRKKVKKTE